MLLAIEAVQSKRMGYLKASICYNVPKSTLERRAKGQNKTLVGASKGLGRFKTTLPAELEQELTQYIIKMEESMFGLTTRDIRSMAYQLASRNNLEHNFNSETELAGLDWLQSFIKRHPLSIRTPEATSAARAMAFNRHNVNRFFDLLEELQENSSSSCVQCR